MNLSHIDPLKVLYHTKKSTMNFYVSVKKSIYNLILKSGFVNNQITLFVFHMFIKYKQFCYMIKLLANAFKQTPFSSIVRFYDFTLEYIGAGAIPTVTNIILIIISCVYINMFT